MEPFAPGWQQVERIAANRSAAFRKRAALAESRAEQMGIGWIEDQLAEIMGEELTQPTTDPTQSEVEWPDSPDENRRPCGNCQGDGCPHCDEAESEDSLEDRVATNFGSATARGKTELQRISVRPRSMGRPN